MSTPTAKRPPAGSRDSPTASPSRQPRASTPSSGDRTGTGTATPTSSVGRTRSVRSSTLVSARAAAAQRRESLLSNSKNAPSPGADTASNTEAEEAARAETLALLDDLKERLSKAEGASEQYQRQNDVLQARLDEVVKEHSKLEERVHEYDEQAETLKNEKREMARQIQQMETIYEAERSAMTREKEDMSNREEEKERIIQRLKDSLAQRNADDEGRPSRITSNSSPGVDSGSFAPPSSLHRSDSRNNSKLLLQKDKLIESLRLELAEAQIKLVESENQGGGRLHEVERQLMEARMANARLMEDNESYQLLLQEKTLKGDFGMADFGFGGGLGLISNTGGTHSRPRSSNEDALNALEGRGVGGSSLADELNDAAGSDSDEAGAASGAVANGTDGVPVEGQRRLEAELKSLQDQNKALTLYINKIIERLLEHQDYQYILDKSTDGKQPLPPAGATATSANTDKELPPPPPPKPQQTTPQPSAIQSFLQRTKSITSRSSEPAAAAGAATKRPRPVSYMPEAVMSNPDTAPSIPISLTRTTSMRRPIRPMSEQFTGAGGGGTSAASVVNAMYKGGGVDGPLSPGLRSSQFFGSGTYAVSSGGAGSGSGSGARSPGGNGASGNFPGMRSETSSVSGDSASGERASGGTGSDTSPPQSSSNNQNSPPRPVHEKTAFTGSKPRPLRLVQENTDSVTPTANKRASWMGWWGKKEDGSATAPGSNGTPTLTGMPTTAEPIQE
ncbi:m serotype protein [Sporothrix brasiliensis 5110]|uniref:M serotype protein n=1 Tax=Sporothrix brasiliensis 5110 TaxID=1398154 RepID=A0A0C2ICC5_9PEZI|nr:m serotype protein [Sporothrix brasiliensis 5110]KIH86961.1 m serotype protein [Sporothrix brasiliensis 5110]